MAFRGKLKHAFAITGRGPVLAVEIVEGSIRAGERIVVELVDGTTRKLEVRAVEFVDHGHGAAELGLVVDEIDPSQAGRNQIIRTA